MNDLTELRREAYRSLLVAHARLMEAMDKRMMEAGTLPITWYDVLVTLEYADGHRLRMTELAERILLSKSGLTRLVDRLVEKGYVERMTCAKDRRVSYAVLTDKGQREREASWPLYSKLIDEFFGAYMDEQEAKTVLSVLKRASEGAPGFKKPVCP